jgi:hypothetical protein
MLDMLVMLMMLELSCLPSLYCFCTVMQLVTLVMLFLVGDVCLECYNVFTNSGTQ